MNDEKLIAEPKIKSVQELSDDQLDDATGGGWFVIEYADGTEFGKFSTVEEAKAYLGLN